MADETNAHDAAALWGSAQNIVYPPDQRLRFALAALDYYGGLAEQADLEEERRAQVPEELRGMPAKDRASWLAVERVYDAIVAHHPGEARTMSTFRELRADVQQSVILTVLPLIQALHGVGLNPYARADHEAGDDRG